MKQIGNQRGTVLLYVLLAVTIMGLLAGIAGTSWKTVTQRAKEEELLWRGNQYRRAIAAYYNAGKKGAQGMYPRTLEQLIRDPRSLGVVRYLRRLYPDPLTGGEWELIKDSNGLIQGVHSRSQLKPFKTDGFPEENDNFAGKTSYDEWRFVYTPKHTREKNVPANKPIPFATEGSTREQKN
ncbi:MAG: type II secretion system protein [Desulfuromonadaceae bacterium]|jgi:type II secretory pathway pseudopilin PulG